VAVGAAAAAAVTAVVVAETAVTPGPVQHARTAAYVVSRTQAALALVSSQNVIQYTRETDPAGIFIGAGTGTQLEARTVAQWSYRGQHRFATYNSGGRITSDQSTTTAGREQITTMVSYRDKTWWRRTVTLPPPASATPQSSCEEATVVEGGGLMVTDLAAKIATALSCGQYVVAGTQRVDGVQAIELKPVKMAGAAVFWIDPSTYLPVRDQGAYGSRTLIWDDFQWLPPTPANLAALHVHIPAGFTQIPPSGD
jgi:hypothetical protein